jgi:hypothetical protein
VDYLFTSRRLHVAQQPKNEQHDENRSKSAATDIHVILRGYMRRYRIADTWLIGADGGYLTYPDTSGMTGPHLAPLIVCAVSSSKGGTFTARSRECPAWTCWARRSRDARAYGILRTFRDLAP